jgi:hypothetical protein
MKISEFIDHILTFANPKDILNSYTDKGFVYERLWDIIIKFGFCQKFPRSQFKHLVGNVNTGNLQELTTFKGYIEQNFISGNSSGCSDITLFDTKNKSHIFISCKYIKTDSSVDAYDVQNIVCMAQNNKHIYPNYQIYLIVQDATSLLDKVKKSNKSSENITKFITSNNILDINDLQIAFSQFKGFMIDYNKPCDYDKLFMKPKDYLSLRFHQKMIINKTMALIGQNQKNILWGCKCRSGKTYMVGGIVPYFNNILIITPVPNETICQFTTDLFYKFADFEEYQIHNLVSPGLVLAKNIFITSKQFLQRYIGDKAISCLKSIKLDLIVFDENHLGGTTELSKNILDTYSISKPAIVYLTATYRKPLNEWNIPKECQIYWDIEDEQLCKSLNINGLIEKHGPLAKCVNTRELEIYKNMPDLHILTGMFDNVRYQEIKNRIMGTKYGFSFDVLFSLNKTKKKFEFENDVKTILRYISGSQKETDFKDGDLSIFGRITKLCSQYDSRQPFTQLWFLPPNNINEISVCLELLISKDTKLKQFGVLIVNSKSVSGIDIKHEIANQQQLALKEGKRGLIILAGNMLSLGVTLSNCDVVMLLNDTLSCDKVFQQMYRCMSEAAEKTIGIVVDLNTSRVLNTCINYGVCSDLTFENKIIYIIRNHLINIDCDMFDTLDGYEPIVNNLIKIWQSDPINSFKTLLHNLDSDFMEFDTTTQRLINRYFISNYKKHTIDIQVCSSEPNDKIQTGKEVITSDKKEEIKISFTKDVLPYVIPLSCILTYNESNKDFVEMLDIIKQNQGLLDIFNEQCFVWWTNKNLIDIIYELVSKHLKGKNNNTYKTSLQFKTSMTSLIDNPKQLLELINECLVPKEVEKKKFGEVFTPLKFINTEQLEGIYIHQPDVWTNPNYKWYDPAAGMGNYPIAIYYKLIDGLKTAIPNPIERKRHIIENMLYMSELNKKNCFVLKQIFNMENQYKLNLYEGDSLAINIKKQFDVEKFDIIIGNPPYNEELKSTGANPLYNKFIEYYMDKCTMLSFIIPSRWFSSGKGLDSFRKFMLARRDIVYIEHYDDAAEIFGNHVDIKGGVNYFLKDSRYSGNCEINGRPTDLNKYDVLVESKYFSLIDQVCKFDRITKLYIGRCFGIETNDPRLSKTITTEKTLKCYVSQQSGFIKYIDPKEVKKDYNFWKVIIARAAHAHGSGFGNIFAGTPEEVHSGTYISFRVDSKLAADSLVSFLKCKMPNFMLSLRKSSQAISNATCEWIPLPTLDRIWTDQEIYEYFDIIDDEISHIEKFYEIKLK